MNKEELAWAAGFFDGEGCFWHGVRRKKTSEYRSTETRITQAHAEVLERFRDAVGLGKIYGPYGYGPNRPNWRPQWQYLAHGFHQTQAIIAMLWPWLGSVKRDQAREVLQQVRDHPPRKTGRPPKARSLANRP